MQLPLPTPVQNKPCPVCLTPLTLLGSDTHWDRANYEYVYSCHEETCGLSYIGYRKDIQTNLYFMYKYMESVEGIKSISYIDTIDFKKVLDVLKDAKKL